ncbi:MAG: hypothetical protein ACOVT5_17370 [Armatimonadaceae bacterium]|jgi:hypothetical protein
MNATPLLVVALMVFGGMFAYVIALERKIAALEKRLGDLPEELR